MPLHKLKNIIGKEDIALAVVILGVLGVVLFMGGSEQQHPDYTPSQFCTKAAQESEANLSAQFSDVSCRCVSPQSINRPEAPQKVENVTEYNDVLVCDIKQLDRKLIFPLLRINETKYSQYNQSELNDTQIIQNGRQRSIPS